ncbi:MAG: hypothetical protein ACSHWQ_05865, partial [Spongiibacteraceae bacterium]
ETVLKRGASLLLILQLAGCANFYGGVDHHVDNGGADSDLQPMAMSDSRSAVPRLNMDTEDSRQALLGKWYAKHSDADGSQKAWLIERRLDGTYRADIHLRGADGLLLSQSAVGYWGVSEGVYFEIYRGRLEEGEIKVADPSESSHYEAYKILSLNAETFQYRRFSGWPLFTMKKMSAEFTLPLATASQQTREPLRFEY